MLQFTDVRSDRRVWINPTQVSALTPFDQDGRDGCLLHLAGGFEIAVREGLDDVATQIQKKLAAY